MVKVIFANITNTITPNTPDTPDTPDSVVNILSRRLAIEAEKHNVPLESSDILDRTINQKKFSEGTFKSVYTAPGMDYVVQVFKDLSISTLEARIKETVCCLKTKNLENTCQIRSVYTDENDDIIGISMDKYSQTLKDFAFASRSQITGEQKYKLVLDLVKGVKGLHDVGFAHCDLSEVNLMVNVTSEYLPDGSETPELVVIDFGKAEFINRDDVLAWSVDIPTNDRLERLPLVESRLDHGYKLYRSAETLPRKRGDRDARNPIDPCAEDVYGVGVLIWRIFSGQSPWGGVLDTDIRKLYEIINNPQSIDFYINKVNGATSQELLRKCLTVTSKSRIDISSLLDFLLRYKNVLISEWTTTGRKTKEAAKLKISTANKRNKRRRIFK